MKNKTIIQKSALIFGIINTIISLIRIYGYLFFGKSFTSKSIHSEYVLGLTIILILMTAASYQIYDQN